MHKSEQETFINITSIVRVKYNLLGFVKYNLLGFHKFEPRILMII